MPVLLRSWAVGSYGDTGVGQGVGRAGLEIPLGMGENLFDPIGVSKAARQVQRFLCDHLPPGFGDESAEVSFPPSFLI